jgi:hypothetical protein
MTHNEQLTECLKKLVADIDSAFFDCPITVDEITTKARALLAEQEDGGGRMDHVVNPTEKVYTKEDMEGFAEWTGEFYLMSNESKDQWYNRCDLLMEDAKTTTQLIYEWEKSQNK